MSKKSLIDSIEIKSPCSEDWDKMKGSRAVRFCGHCDLHVNNISELTRKQAMRLVRESNGRLCVRYVKNPVTNKPLFVDRLYRISRRAGIAAGVLGASLTLSTLAYGQGDPALNKIDIVIQNELSKEKNSDPDPTGGAAISFAGTITDPNGAKVPNATVTITNLATNFARTAPTDEEGAYRFENVDAGRYKIQATAIGYKESSIEMNIYNGEETGASLALETDTEIQVMGGVGFVAYSNSITAAVSNDDLEAVKRFISRGDNVNEKDENYNNITPLFIAVENGSTEIAEMLLNAGAKVNAKDGNKQTPLMRLDEDASIELVDLLLRHGAKVNLIDKDGNTALIFAASAVKPEVLQILTRYVSNIDVQNSEGRTALMQAADSDNLESVRALLFAGAAANLIDKQGESAINLTTDQEIENLLTEYGATVKDDSN